MAATTKFITTSDFSTYQDLSSYIATAYIDRYILSAQENHIRPILGDVYYDTLQTAVAGSTTTSDQDDLIAKIKPVLVYRTSQEYLTFAGIYATNMGMRVLNDEQSREATPDEVRNIAERVKFEAEKHTRILWEYLDDNKDTFTVWRDDTNRWPKKRKIGHLTAVRAKDTGDRVSRTYDGDF